MLLQRHRAQLNCNLIDSDAIWLCQDHIVLVEVRNNDPPHGADHCYELPLRQYDPDKAKWHLNRSGYSSAELYVAEVATGIGDSCLLMQNNLKKIGFDLKIKKVPTDGYWGAVWMKEPLNVVS